MLRGATRGQTIHRLISAVPARRRSFSALRKMSAQSRGALIVFEGADRAGKSTQCSRLIEYLERSGRTVELWKFPDRTAGVTGVTINDYLTNKVQKTDKEIHLLFSENRREKQQQMEIALAKGTTIVCDRYAYSGVAYTAAKGVDGMGLDWCKAPDAGLPSPDALIFMELSEEEAAKRGEYGQERYEKVEFQKKVLEVFRQLREPWWDVVDAGRSADAVAEDVQRAAAVAVERCAQGSPLGRLWEPRGSY